MIVKSKITGEMVDLSEVGAIFPTDIYRDPMKRLGAALARRMKGLCPVGKKGYLQKSIANKTVVYAYSNRVVAIVGPRRRAPGTPTKYAHLVEFGHVAKGAAGKHTTHVPAHPFVRPTAEIARSATVDIIGPDTAASLAVALHRAGKKSVATGRQKWGKRAVRTTDY